MHNLRARAGDDWMLAGTFLKDMNDRLDKDSVTHALFYHTHIPLLEEMGGVKRDGKYQYVKVSLFEPWVRYAKYRQQMVRSGMWIGRRKWSIDDYNAVNKAQVAPVASEMAVAGAIA